MLTTTKKILSYEVLELGSPITHSVIWLHGLGADGHDFIPIVKELNLPPDKGIRFIFPHAPVQPISINSGMQLRAWYDIKHINLRHQVDEPGIHQAAQAVSELMDMQINRGIRPQNLFLAGFSQGGAIALHLGLHYPQRLAGIIALSTYLPIDLDSTALPQINQHTPIFMGHGRYDPIVPLATTQDSIRELQQHHKTFLFKIYPMMHQVCPEEIQDIRSWLLELIDSP